MTTEEQIIKLSRQLLPTGRAWKFPKGGYGEGLLQALAITEGQAIDDAASIMDSLMPDTARFTADDATIWERNLGLAINQATPLADRKAAIRRKMAAPGTNKAKGHYLYIQNQLRAANFDVYVFENRFPAYPTGYDTENPATLNPLILSVSQHGDHQHNGIQSHYINHVVANSIYNEEDISFYPGSSLKSTFFIGGDPVGTYADVDATREVEFRQLILKLKQVQDIAYLFINYI